MKYTTSSPGDGESSSLCRPIPGFEGYVATSAGLILSLRQGEPRVLAMRMHNGYLHVNIRLRPGRGNQRKRPVHALICTAWHGPRPDGMECRHLDGNVRNCKPDNLCWGTQQENMLDQVRHGTAIFLRRGDAHPRTRVPDATLAGLAAQWDALRDQVEAEARRAGVDVQYVWTMLRRQRLRKPPQQRAA